MRQLLLLALLCCCLSAHAQIYLDSLPPGPIRLEEPIIYDLPTMQVQIGYGKQEVRTFNGAVTHLEAKQFNQGQINDWNQLWHAQVPGFTVARAGSNPNEAMDARIRGLRTLSYGTTKPLYVVDGVPGVDFFAVDPSDIVSVDVLRDAASTAIYGGRGATGVVLITTKPATSGPLKIQYQGQVSIESAARRYTVFNEDDYLNSGGNDLSPSFAANTDWQEEVLQSGVGHAHHLSASKGWGQGFVKAGLHYRNVTGVLRESGFEQYNGNLLAEQRFWHDRLTLSAGATLGQRKSNYGFPEAYKYAVISNPSSPIRSDDPAYIPNSGYVENQFFDYFNPVAIIEQNRNSGRTDFYLLHARAELMIVRNLSASVQVSEQSKSTHDIEYYSPYARFRGQGTQGLGVAGSDKSLQKTLESTLTYRFNKSDWQGELLAGFGWYHNVKMGNSISGTHLQDQTWMGKTWNQYRDLLKDLHEANVYQYLDYHFQSDRQLTAFFGRAQVQWQDTYFGSISWRKEGSSNLPPATRWAVFPGFSLGVDANKWLNMPRFDYLKISVGHGVTSTEPTTSGLYQRIFNQGPKFYYNGQYVPSYGITQNPNDQLGWERTTENSLSLRFSRQGGRLQGSIDWYRSRSRELVAAFTKATPPNFAYTTIENGGEIAGHGTELTLNYQLAKGQNLTWEVGLSAATSVSTLEAGFTDDTLRHAFPGGLCGCDVYYQLLYTGATIGTAWGPVANGIDADGAQTYADINGNGQTGINETSTPNRDQTKLGDAEPRWQLGLYQKLTWRNIDLSFMLQAVTGHEIINGYRNGYEANNPVTAYYNTVVTRYYDADLQQTRFNSRIVENGSFLRMQYVTLGYQLPLPKNKWINGLHFQIGAQNLFTLTQYTGLDPELRLQDTGFSDNGSRSINADQGDVLAPGIDRVGTYPTARRWWLGVQATF